MQIQKNTVLKYNLGIMKFSDKLKKLRQEHNLTQNQLADRLGVSLSVIALIESDKRRPSREVAIRLSQCFNLPLQYFLISDNSDDTPQRTIIDNDLMIDIVDAVTEFLHENNLDISPDQRRELIKHFYGQNCHDVNRIREILSGMLALNSHAFGKGK